MVILIAVLTAFAGFVPEAWPRVKVRYFGIDTWRHLMVADVIRREKRLPKELPEKYILTEPSDYPPLFRILLAFLPKKFLEEWQGFISPFFDFIHSLILFYFTYMWTRNWAIAWMAQIAYVANPLIVMENSNSTTRPIASLLFTVAFLSTVYFAHFGGAVMLLRSLVLTAALILTHRFALQALLALTLAFCLFEKTWLYVALLLGAMALAAALTKGFYLKVLWGHIQMLNWWRLNIRNRYAHQVRGLMKKGEKSPDIVFRMYQFVLGLPPIAVLAAIPCVILAVATVLWHYLFSSAVILFNMQGWVSWSADFSREGIISPLFDSLSIWAMTLLGVAILIRSIRWVEWAGEGERYMEFGAFPTAVLTSLFVWNVYRNWPSPWVFVAYAAFILVSGLLPALFLQKKVILDGKDRAIGAELRQVFDFINQRMKGEVRMATIPLGLADSTMYFTKAKVFSTDSSLAHYNHYSDFFPVIRKPLDEIFAQYGVNTLLVNENYAKPAELPLKGKKEIFRVAPYVVFEINKDVIARSEATKQSPK